MLRHEGTERPFTSPLNDEHRAGVFVCAGCALPLFTSAMKFDSGTGWPSYFTTIPGAFATKTDHQLILPRTEYHCAKCGGHHGHVFDDGPQPTGLRYCNNGVALRFIPSSVGLSERRRRSARDRLRAWSSYARVRQVVPGPAPRRIFDDLSLDVARGEFVAVVGASGVGKSTLLNLIAGLERVDAGHGHRRRRRSARRSTTTR